MKENTPEENTSAPEIMVVAKGDAREGGDPELELFQISQNTWLPGLSVYFLKWWNN